MRLIAALAAALSLAAWPSPGRAGQVPDGRLRLEFDTSEAEAVLSILAKRAAHQGVGADDWRRLFQAEPYARLKAREASMGRAFADSDFQRFVLSDSLAGRTTELRQTLDDWKRADLAAAAARAFAYLPADATIRAKVYPVIKPKTNSFVFEPTTNPAIFLYLNPAETQAQFENTVAHELHHIGYASVAARFDSAIAALPPQARAAAEWMGAFGEGFAMLAAAGGPDVHPHADSPPEDRARWDRDVANVGRDLPILERFFLDVAQGRLATPEDRQRVAGQFFGVQGPWYTVGWKMAVVIERRFGRARLIACMLDPRSLLVTYDRAAAELNGAGGERLPLWSDELLRVMGAAPGP
ncbi:MAG TPA: DUF5700 domain-containing putative Zn-dependent protease [Gemmatimonadales bacterium]|nr:DUF5700 domain-containing putative Zn-dependent protease [Gemmatimonadales bacterium]